MDISKYRVFYGILVLKEYLQNAMNYLTIVFTGLLLFIANALTSQTNPCLPFHDYRIVVLGSSTAAGTGASIPDSAWVNQYRSYLQAINSSNEVINLARGGYSTYRLLPNGYDTPTNRPPVDTARNISAALQLEPDAIIINMPSNDVAAGFSLVEQLANFDTIVRIAQQDAVPIWICTTQPRNFSNPSLRQLQADVKDSILVTFAPFVIDFWTAIALPDHSIDPAYDSGDGVHLNDSGHALLFAEVVATDIPDFLYTANPMIDLLPLSISPQLSSACGDEQTTFELVVTNTGVAIPDSFHISFSLKNTKTGTNFSYAEQFESMLSTCASDTFTVIANTAMKGDYLAQVVIRHDGDMNHSNDTLYLPFQTLGQPNLSLIGDTLCEPGGAYLEALHESGDTIYWYDAINSNDPLAYGAVIVTPILDTTSIWYAEAIRGDLYYTNSLLTASEGSINWNGTMFNLVATEDLHIDSFAIKINSPGLQAVEIYYKPGSYIGYELNALAWTEMGTRVVNVTDSTQLTTVPIGGLTIPANDTVGIYIQLANPTATLSYRTIAEPQIRTTPELMMITGSGVSHDFTNQFFPRDWNGGVFYHYGERPFGDCSTGRQAVQVVVNEILFNIGRDTIIDFDANLLLMAPPGMLYYEWFDGSNSPQLELSGSDLGLGIHHISIEAMDSLGCHHFDELIVGVADLVSAADSKQAAASIYAFPNPTNGLLTFSSSEIERVELLSSTGKGVIDQRIEKNELDIRHVTNGAYWLKMILDDRVVVQKIVKLKD